MITEIDKLIDKLDNVPVLSFSQPLCKDAATALFNQAAAIARLRYALQGLWDHMPTPPAIYSRAHYIAEEALMNTVPEVIEKEQ